MPHVRPGAEAMKIQKKDRTTKQAVREAQAPATRSRLTVCCRPLFLFFPLSLSPSLLSPICLYIPLFPCLSPSPSLPLPKALSFSSSLILCPAALIQTSDPSCALPPSSSNHQVLVSTGKLQYLKSCFRRDVHCQYPYRCAYVNQKPHQTTPRCRNS